MASIFRTFNHTRSGGSADGCNEDPNTDFGYQQSTNSVGSADSATSTGSPALGDGVTPSGSSRSMNAYKKAAFSLLKPDPSSEAASSSGGKTANPRGRRKRSLFQGIIRTLSRRNSMGDEKTIPESQDEPAWCAGDGTASVPAGFRVAKKLDLPGLGDSKSTGPKITRQALMKGDGFTFERFATLFKENGECRTKKDDVARRIIDRVVSAESQNDSEVDANVRRARFELDKFQDQIALTSWQVVEQLRKEVPTTVEELRQRWAEAEKKFDALKAGYFKEVTQLRDRLRKMPDGFDNGCPSVAYLDDFDTYVDAETKSMVEAILDERMKKLFQTAEDGGESELYKSARRTIQKARWDVEEQLKSQSQALRERVHDLEDKVDELSGLLQKAQESQEMPICTRCGGKVATAATTTVAVTRGNDAASLAHGSIHAGKASSSRAEPTAAGSEELGSMSSQEDLHSSKSPPPESIGSGELGTPSSRKGAPRQSKKSLKGVLPDINSAKSSGTDSKGLRKSITKGAARLSG